MSHQTLIFSALPVRLTDRCPKATQRHHHRAAEANEADDGRDERGLYLRVHSLLPNRAAFIYCVPSSFVGTLFPTRRSTIFFTIARSANQLGLAIPR